MAGEWCLSNAARRTCVFPAIHDPSESLLRTEHLLARCCVLLQLNSVARSLVAAAVAVLAVFRYSQSFFQSTAPTLARQSQPSPPSRSLLNYTTTTHSPTTYANLLAFLLLPLSSILISPSTNPPPTLPSAPPTLPSASLSLSFFCSDFAGWVCVLVYPLFTSTLAEPPLSVNKTTKPKTTRTEINIGFELFVLFTDNGGSECGRESSPHSPFRVPPPWL